MADALITGQEIAILCDALEGSGANLNADKKKVLDQLIAKGFVVVADQESPAKYKLTGKAQQARRWTKRRLTDLGYNGPRSHYGDRPRLEE